MKPKDLLIKELEDVSDSLAAEVLDFLQFLKTKRAKGSSGLAEAREVLATVAAEGTAGWEDLNPGLEA